LEAVSLRRSGVIPELVECATVEVDELELIRLDDRVERPELASVLGNSIALARGRVSDPGSGDEDTPE